MANALLYFMPGFRVTSIVSKSRAQTGWRRRFD
jgi:hypothetical protein